MYSPVFLSNPTTSGSPPVLSISLSDHSFSLLASNFAWTLAHSRPLWRFMFFSKRSFNARSSSSRCFGDNSFLLLFMLFIFVRQHTGEARRQTKLRNRELTPDHHASHQAHSLSKAATQTKENQEIRKR